MHHHMYTYICSTTFFSFVGVVPLKKTTIIVENSGIFCAFYLTKMTFNLRFGVYAYTCTYINICIYIYIYICTCISIDTDIYIYIYIYI